jgi:hypothetical protein
VQDRTRSGLLNAGIAVLGVLLVGLLYGLGARLLQPPGANVPATSVSGDIPQVEVLNGTAVDGLASQARAFLASRGVDVLATGNYAGRNESRSHVLSRTGDLVMARRVAAALGIRDHQVRAAPQSDLLLDATVVLGADYATLLPFLPDSTR